MPKSPFRPSLWRLSRGFSVHGDIQTVFDVEPPPSIEQEIANEDDLHRQSLEDDFAREFGPEIGVKRTRTNTSKSRRDSVAPFAGITGRLRDLLVEGSEDGDGDVTIKKRLQALEDATERIELMLGRLCEELDDRSGKSGSVEVGETGTIDDLDRSGTADIDE